MDNLSEVVDLDFNIVSSADDADFTLVLDLNEFSSFNEVLGTFIPTR